MSMTTVCLSVCSGCDHLVQQKLKWAHDKIGYALATYMLKPTWIRVFCDTKFLGMEEWGVVHSECKNVKNGASYSFVRCRTLTVNCTSWIEWYHLWVSMTITRSPRNTAHMSCILSICWASHLNVPTSWSQDFVQFQLCEAANSTWGYTYCKGEDRMHAAGFLTWNNSYLTFLISPQTCVNSLMCAFALTYPYTPIKPGRGSLYGPHDQTELKHPMHCSAKDSGQPRMVFSNRRDDNRVDWVGIISPEPHTCPTLEFKCLILLSAFVWLHHIFWQHREMIF